MSHQNANHRGAGVGLSVLAVVLVLYAAGTSPTSTSLQRTCDASHFPGAQPNARAGVPLADPRHLRVVVCAESPSSAQQCKRRQIYTFKVPDCVPAPFVPGPGQTGRRHVFLAPPCPPVLRA